MSLRKPLDEMGLHTDLRKNTRNLWVLRTEKEKNLSSQPSRTLKLPDEPKVKFTLVQSHVDLDNENKQSRCDSPRAPFDQNQKKQQFERKGPKEGELVKHMSNLPGYLQRVETGESLQEKALNFGVLEWGRLENWKYNQKQTPRHTIYPPTSNNTSSPFSTVGSTSLSTRSDSGTQVYQQKHLPSLHSDRIPSSKEIHFQGVKPSRKNATAFQEFRRVPVKSLDSPRKLPRTDQSPGKNNWDIKLDKGKGKCSDRDITSDKVTSTPNSKHDEVLLCPGGKTRARECTSQYREIRLPDQLRVGKQKTIVLLLPRDTIEKSSSQQTDSKAVGDVRPKAVADTKNVLRSFRIDKQVHFAEIHSDITHSCPLPCKFESGKQWDMNLTNSIDARSVPFPLPHSSSCSTDTATVQSRDKHEKQSTPTTKSSDQPGSKSAEEAATAKGRILSPNHFSGGLGQISRSFSSKEVYSLPPLTSAFVSAKSGPVGLDAPDLDNSSRNKANANIISRSSPRRSSPLRRLLDPLLRHKAGNRQSVEDESRPAYKACEESTTQSSVDIPVKKNLNTSGPNPTSTEGSNQDEKNEGMMVQALLKVSVKNGLPSFTFVVDDNILTATMKKISTSEKYDCSWVYTFYSFQKSKKKSAGWINQGSKGKSKEYKVGEMTVSGSKCLCSSNDQFMLREFLLFGVEQKPEDKTLQDFRPYNELAAIVAKVPKEAMGKLSSDEVGLSDCFQEKRCSCISRENLLNEHKVGSQTLPNTIVILPRGVHGLPATGVPTSLIDRWRSGGSCDCGGWDVGCSIRIIASQDQFCRNPGLSIGFPSAVQFDLFDQGGIAREKKHVFSLGTFMEGIYSVDFTASASSLQAFSICTALLHSRRLAELSQMSNLLDDKISQELISSKSNITEVSTGGLEEDAPIHVPFPPLSPVGRV